MENGFWEEYSSVLEDDPEADWAFLDVLDSGQTDVDSEHFSGRKINAYDFLHGDCVAFAQYLNEKYGYEVEIAYQRDDDEEDSPARIVHAYCIAKASDGKDVYVDVRGANSDWDEFMREFYDQGLWANDDYSFEQPFANGVPADLKVDKNSSAYRAAAELDEEFGYCAGFSNQFETVEIAEDMEM